MAKKKTTKTDKKSNAPLKATAAEHEVQDTEKAGAAQAAEEIKAESPKVAEKPTKKLPQPKPTRAARKKPQKAAHTEAAGERTPAAKPAKAPAPANNLTAEPAEAPAPENNPPAEPVEAPAPEQASTSPRRSVAFIGSECYPFVKTGGLGDVMYALP